MHTLLPLIVVTFALAFVGCKGGDTSSSSRPGEPSGAASAQGVVHLNGSGASFPNPLYQKWIAQYGLSEKHVRINYQSVGSGAGIKAITDKTVDFGGSDAPMTDEQLAKAQGAIVHVPMALGAVVVIYNVKGAPDHLKLSPDTLVSILLGEIKTWNDPKIAALNAGADLPALPIGVVYRSDGSGTTAIFTDYLSKVSPAWKERVGAGTSVKWPVGTGANKNDGVTNQVKQTPGALGYVELAYARQNQLPTVALENRAGKFVEPTLEAITAAAAGAASKMPDDLRVSIVDADGEASYPIAAFTYALVYADTPDPFKGAALAKFLWWGLHEGQKLGPALDYAPLPPDVVTKAEAKLLSLTSGGAPLLEGK